MRHAFRLWMAIGLIVLLAGCFRDASDSRNDPTAREVNLADMLEQQSLTPRPTSDVPSATATLEPIRIDITPTTDKTLIVGGPPANSNDEPATEAPLTETPTASPTDDATATPSPSPSPTVPSATPTDTTVPDDVATMPRPGFADTGISRTPLPTSTPTTVILATPTDVTVVTDPCTYLVQGGDTVLQISRDLDISLDDLYAVNPILALNPDNLQVAQQIRIPGCEVDEDGNAATVVSTPTTALEDVDGGDSPNTPETTSNAAGQQIYIVQSGDNLFRIAVNYETTVEALVAANDFLLSENTPIFPGDEIIIPASE